MRAKHLKSRVITLKEWAELSDDVRGEFVDGALVEEEMSTQIHDAVLGYLFNFFWVWVFARGGLALPPDHKLAVAPRRGRKPDISVYFATSRMAAAHESVSYVPPDIAVEIITPRPKDARRDRVEKTAEYARFGVRWYWLVDPAVRTIEVLELGPRRRYTLAVSRCDGTLAVPGCRGLKLKLDELWAMVDRLEKQQRR